MSTAHENERQGPRNIAADEVCTSLLLRSLQFGEERHRSTAERGKGNQTKSSRRIFFDYFRPTVSFLLQSVLCLAPWPWTLGLVSLFPFPWFSPCLRITIQQSLRGLRRCSSISAHSKFLFQSVLRFAPWPWTLGLVFLPFLIPGFSSCKLRVSV